MGSRVPLMSYPCPACKSTNTRNFWREVECQDCDNLFDAPNPVWMPDQFGLHFVASVDQAGDYEFDTLVILAHETGTFFWAADSGCSCPTPFEGFGVPDDQYAERHIEPITDYAHFEQTVAHWYMPHRYAPLPFTKVLDFKARVRAAGLR